MSDRRQPPPADRLPTLTEVLQPGPGTEALPALPDPQALASAEAASEGPPSLPSLPSLLSELIPTLQSELLPEELSTVMQRVRPEEVLPAVVSAVMPEAAPEVAWSLPPTFAPAPTTPPIDEAALLRRALDEVQQRVDLLFEMRLREALAPALARAADGLIRDARVELAPALAEIVRDAVARALAAQRAE